MEKPVRLFHRDAISKIHTVRKDKRQTMFLQLINLKERKDERETYRIDLRLNQYQLIALCGPYLNPDMNKHTKKNYECHNSIGNVILTRHLMILRNYC